MSVFYIIKIAHSGNAVSEYPDRYRNELVLIISEQWAYIIKKTAKTATEVAVFVVQFVSVTAARYGGYRDNREE